MSISRGNKSTRTDANSATITTSWTTAPVAGSKVIVWVWSNEFSADPTVKDNGSPQRTFTKAVGRLDSSAQLACHIFYADNVQPSGTYSVTVTFGASSAASCGGLAYSGVASGAPSATNTYTGFNTASADTGAVSNASNALYAGVYADSSAGADTITVGGGFTDQFNLDDGTTFTEGAGSDKINVTGSQTASWSGLPASISWDAAIATWAEAAAAAGLPVPIKAIQQAVARASGW